MMSDQTVRLAAAQVAPAFLDRDATIAKAVSVIEEAGRNGADLVAFPETWVPGYPMWVYGAAGWDDPAAKRAYARLQANAVEVPSRATEDLCAAARRAGTMVVIGINERDVTYSKGTLFNSMLYISAEGELLGVHRKLTPTHAERIIWGVGDGSTLHVFDTPLGRVGGLICWEHWMPLSRYACMPRASRSTWRRGLRCRTSTTSPAATTRSKAGASWSASARTCTRTTSRPTSSWPTSSVPAASSVRTPRRSFRAGLGSSAPTAPGSPVR